jgi:hypothetical protein
MSWTSTCKERSLFTTHNLLTLIVLRIPLSSSNNMTYLFVPKTALYSVFSALDIPYPVLDTVNITDSMEPGDKPPKNISEADTALTGQHTC